MRTFIALIAAAAALSLTAARAADPPASLSMVPAYINYQGRLVAPDGTPYSNTTHTIEARLYDNAGGGTTLWGERYTIKTQDGFFSVLLGSGGTSLPLADTNDLWQVLWKEGGGDPDDVFMGLTVLTDTDGAPLITPVEATPRQQFVTAPFAMRAHQSAYASKSAGMFEALAGVSTPTLTSTQDIVVTKSMRITGTGNALYATRIAGNQDSDLELIGHPGKSVEIAADGGPVRIGRAYPDGEPTVNSTSVTVGQKTSSGGSTTYIEGNNIYLTARDGQTLRSHTKNGTVHLGYHPGSSGQITLPPSGASKVVIGHTTTDVNIQTDNFDLNGLPLFDFQKILFIRNGVSSFDVTVTGISASTYNLMVVGWNCGGSDPHPPRSVFMLNSNTVRFEFSQTGNYSGYVRVLGIQKKLMTGFSY